jgi:hypothetical protein
MSTHGSESCTRTIRRSENPNAQLKIIERRVKLDEKDAQAFRDWHNNNKKRRGIEEVYAIVGVAGAVGDRKS